MSDINELELKLKTVERFWKQVDKTDYCWNWRGKVNKSGLPIFGKYSARRVSLQLAGHVMSKGQHVHPLLCNNKLCINPSHLAYGDMLGDLKEKACTKCGIIKPIEKFSKHPKYKTLKSYCDECSYQSSIESKKKNLHNIRLKQKIMLFVMQTKSERKTNVAKWVILVNEKRLIQSTR